MNKFLGLNGEDWESGVGAFVNIFLCVFTLCFLVFVGYAIYITGVSLYIIGGLVGLFAAIYALAWTSRRWKRRGIE